MESMSEKQHLCEGQILTGSLFNEPMRVETASATGNGAWTLGLVGTRSERFRKVSLTARDLERLTVLDAGFTYDGDGCLLRLGIQAYSLGIAWEFDPYFGLSISRVDPLPHQLEAVYDYLLKLARVRFLLADDAEDRRDCYYLYIVTNCNAKPTLQESVKDPARLEWHEVTKVAHYYLAVNAVTRPMQVRKDPPPYGGERP
jgi:hypothetical protein